MSRRRPGEFYPGTCSNCGEKGVPVTKIRNAQCCGKCISGSQRLYAIVREQERSGKNAKRK